jgi:hypothetical protein
MPSRRVLFVPLPSRVVARRPGSQQGTEKLRHPATVGQETSVLGWSWLFGLLRVELVARTHGSLAPAAPQPRKSQQAALRAGVPSGRAQWHTYFR